MTASTHTQLKRNDRVLTRPWPAADWQKATYVDETFGTGAHYVILDVSSSRLPIARWEVVPMPAEMRAAEARFAATAIIQADV